MPRPPKTDRNIQVTYDVTVEMMTVREAAEKYGISESRVYQILRDQSQQHIPEDVHTAMHSLGLRTIKKAALEIMEAPPAATFDVKGNPLIDPATGDPVYDYGARIKAMDQYVRADREERLLYARDAPRKEHIIVSDQRSEAQRSLEALKKILQLEPDRAREAMGLLAPQAIEGKVEP